MKETETKPTKDNDSRNKTSNEQMNATAPF